MALPLAEGAIYRITRIGNVPWILGNGVHSRNSPQHDPNFREIGNSDLIGKRNTKEIPIAPGGTLSDYVPFYFTPHSPMLLNIKTGRNVPQRPMSEIVILVSSLQKLVECGVPFVFSDRHAYVAAAQFSSDMNDLTNIDWAILHARDFKHDLNNPGKVERYQAEALVHKSVPLNALLGIACHGVTQENELNGLLATHSVTLPVRVKPGWYF
ncbi:MAG: DUF4433 domain-containing protein [Planctomycetes bacterium]|nr:DUF4433 domain-containing protein [Planctomycetota bacterium]